MDSFDINARTKSIHGFIDHRHFLFRITDCGKLNGPQIISREKHEIMLEASPIMAKGLRYVILNIPFETNIFSKP